MVVTEFAELKQAKTAPPKAKAARLTALDGLRGTAAVIVLLHHTFFLNPNWPGTWPQPGTVHDPLTAWLSFSPLKLFTAGWESVMVFFVLSGLVVSLPALRRGFDWIAYYPRRIVRLMVPVIGSVLLAAVWVSAIPQNSWQRDDSWFSSSSTPNFDWTYIFQAVDLFGGDGQINNPLWSLKWEMIFSLLLPVFVLVALAIRRWWVLALVASVAATWVGIDSGADSFSYLSAFLVGALIATRLDDVRAFADRVNARRGRNLFWAAFLAGGAMLLIASWLTGPIPADAAELTRGLRAFTPVAAAMLVVACIGWHPLRHLMSARPFQFFGRISFSLYLVHVPILVFSAYLLAGLPLIVAQIFGPCLALIVAVGFRWLLEARSHGWAKKIGAWASRRHQAVTQS